MTNAQEWLENQEKYNTKEKRSEIKILDINEKGLKGDLNLRDFANLKELDCSYNQLTNLNLDNCQQLKALDCGFNKLINLDLSNLTQLERVSFNDNYLTSFDYLSLNSEKLTFLNMSDNNLPEKELFVFSRFTKLEELWIGGDNKSHFAQNIYNKFFGSLEPLKNLIQLKKLYVDNTDINEGIEYLSSSIETISHSSRERPDSKVKEISEQLKWIGECFNAQQLKEWIEAGFQLNDYGFAFYLTRKGHNPQSALNYEELREEYNKSQGWLDKNYPKEKRQEVSEIYLNGSYLEGDLYLDNFGWLRAIYISHYVDETKLEIKNKSENTKVIKLVNAQEWLEKNYPKNGTCIRETHLLNNKGKTRYEITRLNIGEKKLEGDLDLSDFANLTMLNCGNNKLTNLNISKLTNLTWLICYNNKLTNLNYASCKKLEILNCCNNYYV